MKSEITSGGLTLRDQIAVQILTATITDKKEFKHWSWDEQGFAEHAYRMADEMLRARDKPFKPRRVSSQSPAPPSP